MSARPRPARAPRRALRTAPAGLPGVVAGALAVTLTSTLAVAAPLARASAAEADGSAPPLQARGVANVAHKGASTDAPENTLAAIRQAIAQHANFVGIDVHRTRDGEIVVLHDATLARTTDVEEVFPDLAPWNVRDFTLAEIRTLDAGSWMSPIYTGERIPTLAEVLDELEPSGVGAFLEVKSPSLYGGVDGIGAEVMDLVAAHTSWLDPGLGRERWVVQSFHDDFLRAFADRYPGVAVGTLGGARKLSVHGSWIDQVNVHHRSVDAGLVDAARAAGVGLSTYVVNERPDMRAVVDVGVDAVSTDLPQALYGVLRRRNALMPGPSGLEASVASAPGPVALTLRAPEEVLPRTRVPVRVVARDGEGDSAAWVWVRLQRRLPDGRWATLQRRVTNHRGVLRTSVAARRGLDLRVLTRADARFAASRSPRHHLVVRSPESVVQLGGPTRRRGERSVPLRVRWTTVDGLPLTGRVKVWARTAAGTWRLIRTPWVADGRRDLVARVRGRRTRFRVVAPGGPTWRGSRDVHVVRYVRG